MNEKQHLVPKSYLRRFSDRDRVVLVRRSDPTFSFPTHIDSAVLERGFYNVAEGVRLPQRHVEDLLCEVEGRARPALDAILGGDFPPSPQTRLDVALFVAFQTSRGWRFRNDLDQLAQEAVALAARQTTREQVERILRRMGKSTRERSIDHWHDVLSCPEGVRAVPGRNMQLRYMLEGVQIALDILLARQWRLYDFDEPGLLTSDQPVAMWSPPGEPLGWATAAMVWFPITPNTALAFGRWADERRLKGTETRRRQVVRAVAEAAEQWIVVPPGSDPLDGLALRDFEPIATETVSVEADGDLVREVVRVGRPGPRP